MANVMVYRTYELRKSEQDPIIEEIGEALEKEGLKKKVGVVRDLSGVSAATIYNWFNGKTKCPRYSTVAAVYGALGYMPKFVRESKFDLAAEQADARRWNLRKQAAKLAEQERKAAARKRRRSNGDEARASL